MKSVNPPFIPAASYRIGIDCRLGGDDHAGIGRYIEQLVRELITAKTVYSLVLFFYDQAQAEKVLASLPDSNLTVVYAPIRHYTIREQLLMPLIFLRHQLDLLHVPHFNIPLLYPGQIIVTIHDLLWHEYQGVGLTTLPAWQYRLKHLAYRFVTTQAVHRSRLILVPASTVLTNIIKHYPGVGRRIIVTPEGVDKSLLKLSKKPITRQTNTLLYVGSLYPHKNIDLVLRALVTMSAFRLRIVGARNVFQDAVRKQVEKLKLSDRVAFVGKVSDDQLKTELDQAAALIQPSLHEGFGLTGIEAMARNTPVIASNIPIFHEIYQDAASYFDPTDPADFARAVKETTTNPDPNRLELGRSLAQGYTWSKTAALTLQAYDQILANQHQ